MDFKKWWLSISTETHVGVTRDLAFTAEKVLNCNLFVLKYTYFIMFMLKHFHNFFYDKEVSHSGCSWCVLKTETSVNKCEGKRNTKNRKLAVKIVNFKTPGGSFMLTILQMQMKLLRKVNSECCWQQNPQSV